MPVYDLELATKGIGILMILGVIIGKKIISKIIKFTMLAVFIGYIVFQVIGIDSLLKLIFKG